MELLDTIELMKSEDYKKRFLAEYQQLHIRKTKLEAMVGKWDEGKLNFTPTCPRGLYDEQLEAMAAYEKVLVDRAKLESIDLSE